MREIPLTRGVVAIVDDEDYKEMSAHKWAYVNGYAQRLRRAHESKQRTVVMMHRQLSNAPVGWQVDHINRNKLDNRKSNLRVCTRSENHGNTTKRRLGKGYASAYKGVVKGSVNRWKASVTCKGVVYSLGSFCSELDAARAYNRKAKELFGEFYRGNDLGEDDTQAEAPQIQKQKIVTAMPYAEYRPLALF